MAHIWHNLKDILDVVEGLPGMAAFIKVFFGSEEGQEKMKKRLFTDIRDEVLEDIRMLGPGRRENLVRRLHEAELRGEEDDLVWDFGKIKKEVRRDTLEWFNSLDDQNFKVYVGLLHDNKFRQFARRALVFCREEVAPVMKNALNATGSTTKSVASATASAVRDGAVKVDGQLDRFANWLDS